MRIALMGDVHGNLLAFQAALQDAQSHGAQAWILTGDFIGYYYDPKAVLEILAGLTPKWAVKGNHDIMLEKAQINAQIFSSYQEKYGSGLRKADQDLSQAQKAWLAGLPHSQVIECGGVRILLCHGAPWDPDQYLYPDMSNDDRSRFDAYECDYIVFGHSHYQFSFQASHALIINPGSIGQPRDRKPGAAWSMLDCDKRQVSHHRTDYAVESLLGQIQSIDPTMPYLSKVLTRT